MSWRTDNGSAAKATTVRRFDLGTLGTWERTPTGGLRIPAYPTRSGIFPYRQPDGNTRLEYRPPEEVFQADSLASLGDVAVTDLHPEVNGVRIPVSPDNWAALAKGHVSPDARREGDHVAATVLVQDQIQIGKVLSGLAKELSCGYDCQLELTPGQTPDGQRFDAIQRRIRYNHLAMGPPGWGRAGPTVALRADSGDAEQVPPEPKEAAMKETINGVEYVVGSAEHIAALRGQRDTAMGRADTLDKALKTAQAAPPDQAVIHKAAAARANLLVICDQAAKARSMVFDEKAAAGATMDQLVIQAIKTLDPNAEVDGKSPEYLAGVLDTLARTMKASADEAKPEETGTDTGTPGLPPPAAATKTDGGGKVIPLFKARQGVESPTTKTDTKDQAEAARYDADLAEASLSEINLTRGTKPLAISAMSKRV